MMQLLRTWLAFRLDPSNEYKGQSYLRAVEVLRLDLTRTYWKLSSDGNKKTRS